MSASIKWSPYRIVGSPDDGRSDRIMTERVAADLIIFVSWVVLSQVNPGKIGSLGAPVSI
jgi:hypothetical protein